MITVLRLNHRIGRDIRITTHVALVSRAFGASGMYYTGQRDNSLEKSTNNINPVWGGNFFIEHIDDLNAFFEKNKAKMVHLTMYGLSVDTEIEKIRKNKDLMIIVGGEKVPTEIYFKADYNIAIGNQPHSEVSALAVFLHEYFKGKELKQVFSDAKRTIIPTKAGKKIVKSK